MASTPETQPAVPDGQRGRETGSIVQRHSGSGIMPHDLPLADMMFHSDSLDPLSKAFPLVHTTKIAGSRGPVNQWAGKKSASNLSRTAFQRWLLVGMRCLSKTGKPDRRESRYTRFTRLDKSNCQLGGRLQPFAELISDPRNCPEKSKKQSQKEGRGNSPGFQARVHHVHAPGGAGVGSSCASYTKAIPDRRLVNDLLDSTIEEFGHLQNAAAVRDPCANGESAPVTVLQNHPGRFRCMPQRCGDAV